jgi:hypothetical protein
VGPDVADLEVGAALAAGDDADAAFAADDDADADAAAGGSFEGADFEEQAVRTSTHRAPRMPYPNTQLARIA